MNDDTGTTPPRSNRRAWQLDASVPPPPLVRRAWLGRFAGIFRVAGIVALAATVLFAIVGVPQSTQVAAVETTPSPMPMTSAIVVPTRMSAPTQTPLPTHTPTITRTPTFTPTPRISPTPLPPLIALLAGHSGGADVGAICPDGLREVDITKDVAARAQTLLKARGYRVDILAEFDQRLNASKRDYSPQAFLAIHVDSCVYYASGFKVARAENSAIPQADDRLVRCVTQAYSAATQLPWHEGSITRDMTHYHALNEIDANSPGAILELGFMGSDKTILNTRRDAMAMAVAEGLVFFLRGSVCQ